MKTISLIIDDNTEVELLRICYEYKIQNKSEMIRILIHQEFSQLKDMPERKDGSKNGRTKKS